MRAPVPPIIAMTNPAQHLERRKLWNRAFNTAALKGYEHIIARRANLLVETVAEAKEVDLATRISWFTYVNLDNTPSSWSNLVTLGLTS